MQPNAMQLAMRDPAMAALMGATPSDFGDEFDGDMGAEFGDDYLIHHALKPYLDHEVDRMVISDVRTVREVEVIHQLGGVIVRIDRPGVGPANHDITERMLLNVDHIIVNDGLIVDLRPAVEDTLIVLSTTEAPAIEVEVTWHG